MKTPLNRMGKVLRGRSKGPIPGLVDFMRDTPSARDIKVNRILPMARSR